MEREIFLAAEREKIIRGNFMYTFSLHCAIIDSKVPDSEGTMLPKGRFFMCVMYGSTIDIQHL